MSKSSDHVKRWRKRTKIRLVSALGGKCVCCGYDKCNDALEFHHRDELGKEFGIGNILSHVVSWDRIVAEVKKCVLVCSNCHREIHDGISRVPIGAAGFDRKYETYSIYEDEGEKDECPVCGSLKSVHLITCSRSCAATRSRSVDWGKFNLEKMLSESGIQGVADSIGVSNMAVRKRMKKTGVLCKAEN